MLSHEQLILRIGVAAVLGGIIGYERDRHGRPVGLRTHLIVAMAAATFMVVSSQFVYYQHYTGHESVEVDASRIASSVVSGIGFLAGGAILRTGVTVQGLTTAAGLWLVTAIGLCSGSGMFVESVIVTGMGVVALTVLRRFEDKDDQLVRRRIAVVLNDDPHSVNKIVEAMTALGARVADVEYEKRLDDKKRIAATFDVRVPRSVSIGTLVERLEQSTEIRRVHVQAP